MKPITPTQDLSAIFKLVGQPVIDRTLTLGDAKFRIQSLEMESAPGTVETIVSLLLPELRSAKILDYGCGQQQSRYLQSIGFEVHSCDILPMNIANFTQVTETAKTLPFADDQFDITVISEVVEHVESPFDLLLELARVTKQKLIVTTPNIVSKMSKAEFMRSGRFQWFTPDIDYHITPIPYWQLENFCKRHGITILSRHGNHEIFGLLPDQPMLDNAEVMIYELDVSSL